MTREYSVMIEENLYLVTVSDDREVVLKAREAGKICVGIWEKNGCEDLDISAATYLVESIESLTQEYLEQIVKRNLGLPWIIAETKRLIIREFQIGDEWQIPKEAEDTEADNLFRSSELLKSYIQHQYGFYEYGIWAVVEKESGIIVGKAGVTNLNWETQKATEQERETKSNYNQNNSQETYKVLKDGVELGYHIFTLYRQKGYGTEACQAILAWCHEHLDCPIYAKIDRSNQASIRLAKALGFELIDQKYSELGQWNGLYEWSC